MTLNSWLKNYCATPSNGCVYLDYFSAMVDDKGLLKKDLADDGLHPNAAGFKIMAPMAEKAIEGTEIAVLRALEADCVRFTSSRKLESSFRLAHPIM